MLDDETIKLCVTLAQDAAERLKATIAEGRKLAREAKSGG